MLGFTFTSLALAATTIISGTLAQKFPNQSAPYNLKLLSDEPTLDGKFLSACHSGAAIEQLCVSNTAATTSGVFYLNTTDSSTVSGFDTGVLVYNLNYGGDANLIASSALRFAFNPATNVVLSYFQPGDEGTDIAIVGLDAESKLFIPSYVDDVVTPNGTGLFYQWHVCNTQFGSYKYLALAWVTYGAPLDGDCKAVNVSAVPAAV
ncbi:cell wall protein RHD3 [Podospora fimiseda]|uniref:Cell wall protein RHD3 n=1 Tax=Podospora fimiseda TaxID=252190 RepID=A0AAN7BD57_9PEZI|nr:cell wall protein RHD3 [Podospora fimiseda]